MCDTLVSRTDDGILFAKNSDRHPNESQRLTWHAAEDHPAGSSVRATWIDVPQVDHTHAVLLSRPWWLWGAEIGANEHGVVIGNEAVWTHAEPGPPALLGMDLVRLALERAASAEAAVGVIVDLLERHGQGGPCSWEDPSSAYDNSFLVADPTGAIVLETAGRRWATEVVTGRGRSISNGLTIAPFAAAHARSLPGRLNACAIRQGRTQASADAARRPADLFAALRDHGAGGLRWSPVNGALGGPCAHAGGRLRSTQTTASWVADLRAAPLHWATATAAPCTSIFKPVRVGDPMWVDEPPSGDRCAHPTGNRFDPASTWWRHELVHRLAMADHPTAVATFAPARDRLEQGWLDDPPASPDAFAQAAATEARWLGELAADQLGGTLVDRRPRRVQRLWDALDRRSDLNPSPPER